MILSLIQHTMFVDANQTIKKKSIIEAFILLNGSKSLSMSHSLSERERATNK